jgi:hypothetical protein
MSRSYGWPVQPTDHHRRNECVGAPPPTIAALLALPGLDIETAHAVVIVATTTITAMAVMILRNIVLHPLDRLRSIGIAGVRRSTRWSAGLM